MKKLILILTLLVFIVSVGCVSAADDALASDEVLTGGFDGNFGELQDLIDNADEGDTITLTKDYNGSGEITIDKGLTIDGDGHTIDANYESRIFYINEGNEVFILNTLFTKGYHDDCGGAIYTESPLVISNCEFYHNLAYSEDYTTYGGAVYASSYLVVADSYFNENLAKIGGAIYSENESYIENTIFENNYASYGGGAIGGYYSSVFINGSGFNNNSAGEYAGSIFVGQTLDVYDSVFVSEDENIAVIDYYNDDEPDSEIYLYLENNTIYTPMPYSIWYESVNPIISQVNLVFTEDKTKKGDSIEVARVYDDVGNVIRYDYNITMKIYKENTPVDTVDLYFDETQNGVYYECDLPDGTYKLTGSLGSEYAPELKVYDGKLVVGEESDKKTPTVTASYTKNGNSVTLTAALPSDATGIVAFKVNDRSYDAEVKNGKATETLTLADGSYTVKTSYSGDDNYNWANANELNFVISSTGVVIDAPALEKYYGGSERFTVTLTKDGNPLAGKTVKITINGQTYDKTTDTSGKASMAVNLNSGEYPVTVEAEGQKVSSTVTVLKTISGDDVTKIFRNGTQYYATFVDSTGKTLAENTGVEFNINGVFYTRYTNENGVARMNINLNPGTYIITAKNPSTGEQHTNTITVKTNIIEHKDLTKYYKNDSQYRIRILADDGSIAKAGVKVTFNINGVFYDRYSDDNGYVQMRINLNPGEYTITADYNGLKASNQIKVLNILFGNDVNMQYKDGSKYTVKLLDGQGNPYPGQTIRLNINGVFYDRVTGADGVASLNINLEGGSYTITATYNGLSCSNTVNVIVPVNTYDCGNGHKLEIPSTASVQEYDDEENYIHGFAVSYSDGEASLEVDYYYSDYDSSDRNEVMSNYVSYGARSQGYYGGWGILYMNSLISQGYPNYSLWLGDGYLYSIWADNLNIAKRVAESFK